MIKMETGRQLITVLRCAIEQKPLPKEAADWNWRILFMVAQYHKVDNLAWIAVASSSNILDEALRKKWKEIYGLAVMRELRFDSARKQLYKKMDEAAIAYMPLKGIIIKQAYPQIGMRWMSDHDILYQKDKQKELIAMMSELGYTVENLIGNHDVFHKAPIYNFEMHKTLFDQDSPYQGFYDDVWNRAIKLEENRQEYRMSNLDFYVYNLIHFHKHLTGGGSGLRGVVDLWVLNRTNQYDLAEVGKMISAMGFETYFQAVMELVCQLFGEKQLSLSSENLFKYILNSGIYGTSRQRVANTLEKYGNTGGWEVTRRIKYLKNRMFPEYKTMLKWHPLVNQYPILLPGAYIIRLGKGLMNSYKIKDELREIAHPGQGMPTELKIKIIKNH